MSILGTQPIQVFQYTLRSEFEEVKEVLGDRYPKSEMSQLIFDFHPQNVRIIPPHLIGKTISFHDTFLSFYGIMAQMYMFTNIDAADKEIFDNAHKMLAYAKDLQDQYVRWDPQLPNPSITPDDKILNEIMNRTNGLFIYGFRFILLHELGHHILNHMQEISNGLPVSPARFKELQYEADDFALENSFAKNVDQEFSKAMGNVIALTSLSFMTRNISDSNTYPEPIPRMARGIESIAQDENDIIWMIAGFGNCGSHLTY